MKEKIKIKMTNYKIWNMITSLKNGYLAKKSFIIQKKQRYLLSVLNILWEEGFIQGFSFFDNKKAIKNIKIFLNYKRNYSVIKNITLVTKPSKKIYLDIKQIWKIQTKSDLYLFSTTKGVLTLSQCKKRKLGGELICIVR